LPKREEWAAAIVGSGPIVISVTIRPSESYPCPSAPAAVFWQVATARNVDRASLTVRYGAWSRGLKGCRWAQSRHRPASRVERRNCRHERVHLVHAGHRLAKLLPIGPVVGLHLEVGGYEHGERLAQRTGRVGREQRFFAPAGVGLNWSAFAQIVSLCCLHASLPA
jgi:hypothetical protein